jgi:hypothetical protein
LWARITSSVHFVRVQIRAIVPKRLFYISERSGQIYKGINTNVKSADGSVFEIQYHTTESFNVKQNINHSLYEEYRLLDKSSIQAIKLEEQMIKNSDAIKLPQNINSIKLY